MDELYLAGLKTYLMRNYVRPNHITVAMHKDLLCYSDQCAKYVKNDGMYWDEATMDEYLDANRYDYRPKYWVGEPTSTYNYMELRIGRATYYLYISAEEFLPRVFNARLAGLGLYVESLGVNSFIMGEKE